jgi:hypothetical protein
MGIRSSKYFRPSRSRSSVGIRTFAAIVTTATFGPEARTRLRHVLQSEARRQKNAKPKNKASESSQQVEGD